MHKHLLLLDDGEFYIERDEATTNGFLMRRCPVSRAWPGGCECVGSYQRSASDVWHASINVETASDSGELGDFSSNLDAIAVLWKARRDAYCRN